MSFRPGCLFPLALAAALTVCARKSDGAPPTSQSAAAPVEVQLVQPEWREIVRVVEASGSLLSREEIVIAAQVAGRVQSVAHDLGDAVAGGERLLQLDPVDYQLALEERRRALEQVLAELGLTALPAGDFDPDQQPGVRQALVEWSAAQARAERGARLLGQDPPVISQQEADDLRAVADAAEAAVEVRRAEARSAVARGRQLAAQVDQAAQRLRDTAPTAPPHPRGGDYWLAERFVSAGDFVAAGARLFRLVDADPLRLRVAVPERHMSQVRVGLEASVAVAGLAEPLRARVERVAPEVSPATRTFLVELAVPNAAGRLKAGGFATARIEVGAERVLMVPADAVARFAGQTKVMRVRDGKAVEVRVALGDAVGDWLEVRGGLDAADRLVRAPSAAIVSGSAVREAPAAESHAGAR